MTRRPLRTALAVGGVCIAAAIAYAPSFDVPFQFDDYSRIAQDRALQTGEFLGALAWLGSARVVPALTVVLNYRLGGFEPLGYHLVNFAVHLLATLGVFVLASLLCRTPRLRAAWPPSRTLLLATAAGVLFACHPLQTEAVTYIIQRFASMAALFYVWSVICYLQARLREADGGPRPMPYFLACGALALCAVLSKENAISLPAALLLTEWIGFGRPQRGRLIAVGVLVALAVTVPVLWKVVTWQPHVSGASASAVPFLDRLSDAILAPNSSPVRGSRPLPFSYLLTQATVLPRYLGLVVLPWGLNVDHDIPVVQGFTVPVALGAGLLMAMAALGISQVRRRPLPAFAILWFFVTVSVESSVIPIDDVMAEHRMYLPMIGLALGVGWLFTAAVDRVPRVAFSLGAVGAVALVGLTFARNVIWLSPLTLWVDAAEKSPDKARTQLNAGVAYHQVGRLDEAVEHYCRVLHLNPDDRLAHDNLEIALGALGKFDDLRLNVIAPGANGGVVGEVEEPDAASYCR